MDFSKFDNEIDLGELIAEVDEAKKNGGSGNYSELEAGEYTAKLENLEVGSTKDGRPMLKAMFRIVEGEHTKQCMFLNRVLYGTKNDANMIASAVGWLETLEPSEDVGDIVFESYSQFADLVLDIADDVSELEYLVKYDKDQFNNVSIIDVFE